MECAEIDTLSQKMKTENCSWMVSLKPLLGAEGLELSVGPCLAWVRYWVWFPSMGAGATPAQNPKSKSPFFHFLREHFSARGNSYLTCLILCKSNQSFLQIPTRLHTTLLVACYPTSELRAQWTEYERSVVTIASRRDDSDQRSLCLCCGNTVPSSRWRPGLSQRKPVMLQILRWKLGCMRRLRSF